MDHAKLLSTQEAARRLGTTRRQVRRWIEDGRLPELRLGRDLFLRPEWLAAFRRPTRGRPPARKKKETSA